MDSNSKVSEALLELGEIFAIKGDRFRSRAFLKAAKRVASLEEDVQEYRLRNDLTTIPNIGDGIARIIEEVLDTGTCMELEELRESLPKGTGELMRLEGIGPKLAIRLSTGLGVTTIEELETAARKGRIKHLKGFGEKNEAKILRSIDAFKSYRGRFILGGILNLAKEIVDYLAASEGVLKVDVVGSVRRRRETVGDIDILVASNNAREVTERFTSMPNVDCIISKEAKGSTIRLNNHVKVDLRIIPADSWGSALQYFTGSKEHNVKVRRIAIKKGFKLNECEIYQRETNKKVRSEDEAEIYRLLGMSWIEPELREDQGEVEAAYAHNLPKLIKLDDVKGDLHVHTNWSDGMGSIIDMVGKAREMRLEYIAVCDHSKSLAIARGLDETRLRRQILEIDRLNEHLDGFFILRGIECDIKTDGSLDLPNRVLKDLDYVVGSIHSGFKSSGEEQTERLITAIHNEHVDTIGHLTGRLLLKREPYHVNLEKVFEAAASQGVMIEINAFPDRLDLNDVNCRRAKLAGVITSIGTDAHAPNHMDFLSLGVSVARRGWLEAVDVVNTLNARELLKSLGG